MFLRERLVKDLDVRVMCQSVLKEVTSIWDNVNPKICIIGPKAACGKLFKEWKNAKSWAKKGRAVPFYEQFIKRLDKLFDLANCKCKISECAEQSYSML